jgi:hypothetical protein
MIHELEETKERVKLDVLVSLARCQKALTRMLECVADQAAGLELASAEAVAELRAIAKHQAVLTAKLTGAVVRPPRKRGVPAPPWIQPGVQAREGAR